MKASRVHEYSAIINEFSEQFLLNNGLGYHLSFDAPNSWTELKKHKGNKNIPVYAGASKNTIYKFAYQNFNFRAVHDFCHLKKDANFTLKGEKTAIWEQYIQLVIWLEKAGKRSRNVLKLFLIDTVLQIEYYYETKSYVENQIEFAQEKLNRFTLEQLELKLREAF